jgi:hypothetical protein
MSTYFYAVCDICRLVCPSSTSHGSACAAGDGLIHPFIANHVYCFTNRSPSRARLPGDGFLSAVRIVDEHSWEREQAVTETNGWRKVNKIEDTERREPPPWRGWRSYEALFRWRDGLTDYASEDLIALLARLGNNPPDHRLPPEHARTWKAFGELDEKTRWEHAKAFVRDTESEHHFHNDAERDDDAVEKDDDAEDDAEDDEENDPMRIRIYHDDQAMEIIEKINGVLKHVGFELGDVSGEGDDFVVLVLKDTNEKDPLPSK